MSEFFDTSDLKDIEAEILEAIQDVSDITIMLAEEIRRNYLPQWKTNAGNGPLSSSIKVSNSNKLIVISMLPYGWYNLYGVQPAARTPMRRPAPKLFGVRSQPLPSLLKGSDYQYNSRQFGLPATNFIPELQNQIAFDRFIDQIFNRVEQRIIQD